MSVEQLIKQINTFLDESPFEDSEISFWKERLLKMNEKKLQELFVLLKEKLKIITNTNDLFVNIAEDLTKERDKSQSIIPAKISIIDMPISDLAEIFKSRILKRLKDKDVNIFSELNEYFNNSRLAGENVVEEFDILLKSLLLNNEIFTRKYKDLNTITIGDWLKFYNAFNDKPDRKSIDRINFVNNHEKVKKLDRERKDILLKLLKLYDFLLNPANMEHEFVKQESATKARTVSGPLATAAEEKIEELKKEEERYGKGGLEEKAIEEEIEKEKKIAELRDMAGQYPEGSLERKAIEEEMRKLSSGRDTTTQE